MDSYQQALQTNEKLFFKFKISFRNLGRNPNNFAENQKILKQIEWRGNIDQIEMRYISMDLIRQALLTDVKVFSNFGIIFRLVTIF